MVKRTLTMKLYLVHCGFYETTLASGIYELHVNYLVAAQNFEEAKRRAKEMPEYQARRMHVDGIEEIQAVQGYRVELKEDPDLQDQSRNRSMSYKELEAQQFPQD